MDGKNTSAQITAEFNTIELENRLEHQVWSGPGGHDREEAEPRVELQS